MMSYTRVAMNPDGFSLLSIIIGPFMRGTYTSLRGMYFILSPIVYFAGCFLSCLPLRSLKYVVGAALVAHLIIIPAFLDYLKQETLDFWLVVFPICCRFMVFLRIAIRSFDAASNSPRELVAL